MAYSPQGYNPYLPAPYPQEFYGAPGSPSFGPPMSPSFMQPSPYDSPSPMAQQSMGSVMPVGSFSYGQYGPVSSSFMEGLPPPSAAISTMPPLDFAVPSQGTVYGPIYGSGPTCTSFTTTINEDKTTTTTKTTTKNTVPRPVLKKKKCGCC
eukprot:Platyproteum_vivax@DN2923_c0_g1_i1.p1